MMVIELTCEVHISRVKLNYTLDIVIFQNDNHYGGDISNGWGLIQLEAIFSHCEIHVTAVRWRTI